MKSRIAFIWNETLYPEVSEEDSVIEMNTNDLSEAIELFTIFKYKYEFSPYGFIMMSYEEEDSSIVIVKNKSYIFNGKKIPSEEISWLNKDLKQKTPYYIHIDDNFFIPYNEDNMTLLNINI